MNGNSPAYRKWLLYFGTGLVIFNLGVLALSIFDMVAPLSEPWDSILSFAILAILFAVLGIGKWEERRERQADRSA